MRGLFGGSAVAVREVLLLLLVVHHSDEASAWSAHSHSHSHSHHEHSTSSRRSRLQLNAKKTEQSSLPVQVVDQQQDDNMFVDFCDFLQETQDDIIHQLEKMDGSGQKFSNDCWGCFEEEPSSNNDDADAGDEPPQSSSRLSGGRTRVLQGGAVIEKGAVSLTLIRRGILTAERAATIRARQDININAGDRYSAAALSLVLHTRSPLIPTFRSDVRIFMVQSKESSSTSSNKSHDEEGKGESPAKTTQAWFGGGADLTPYYLDDDDITTFHNLYKDVCQDNPEEFSYPNLKQLCDEYFYLPARDEHRGTGGIFFDDLAASPQSLTFVKNVATTWMPSWLPIIDKHRNRKYSEKQKQWQLLRRGRYLEFNLLYDRGVKFGLAVQNPRVEGVMVSAPPLIAWEYKHEIEEGSEEDRLMKVLKSPKDWAT